MIEPWHDWRIGWVKKRFEACLLKLDFRIQLLALRFLLGNGDRAAIDAALDACASRAERLYKRHQAALQVMESIANSDALLNGDMTSQEAHRFCILSARQFLVDRSAPAASEEHSTGPTDTNVVDLSGARREATDESRS
jgi:hypothetical protein